MLETVLKFAEEHGEVVVAFASAIISVVGALIARRETRRQRSLQTARLRQSLDASSLDWGNQAIDALGRAAMFSRSRQLYTTDAAFQTNKINLLIALSVLVDRGRMFFPNIDPSTKGAHKEGAYRGKRPPILDALMWSYVELDCLKRDGDAAAETSGAFIDDCRRLLVSELQAHLDPRRADEIVERYSDQTHENRADAIARAKTLKLRLVERRPAIDSTSFLSGDTEKEAQ
jgi:hypothetical protein